MGSPPTHIVDTPGDKLSRCGVRDPLPVVWSRFVQAHIDGHGLELCPKCAEEGWPWYPDSPGGAKARQLPT